MPEHLVVWSNRAFQYQGRNEFEQFKSFYASIYGSSYGEVKLNADGSATFYAGSGQYSTIRAGEWFIGGPPNVASPLSDAEFRRLAGPVPTWE